MRNRSWRLVVHLLISFCWLNFSGAASGENPGVVKPDLTETLSANTELSSTQPSTAKDAAAILETTEGGQPATILICNHDIDGAISLMVCSAQGQPYLILSRGSLIMLDTEDPGAVLLLHKVRFQLKLVAGDNGIEFRLTLGKIESNPQSVVDWQPVSLARAAQAHSVEIIKYAECDTFSIATAHTRTILRGLHKYGDIEELATIDVLGDDFALRARTVRQLHLVAPDLEKLDAQKLRAVGLRCKEGEYDTSTMQGEVPIPARGIWSHDGVAQAATMLEQVIMSRPWVGDVIKLSVLDELGQIDSIARSAAPKVTKEISSLIEGHRRTTEAVITDFVAGNISFSTMMTNLSQEIRIEIDSLQKLMTAAAEVQFCSRYLAVSHGLNNINPVRPVLDSIWTAANSMNISPEEKASIALLCVHVQQESDATTFQVLHDHPSQDEISKISHRLSDELVDGLRRSLTPEEFADIQAKITSHH